MLILYNIGTGLYYLLILLASLWNPKAALWISGRRNWRKELETVFSKEDKVIWFHCASLGEFEQGRPLIEKIRAEHSEYKILLSFFSPSGYEKRKDYNEVDHVCYLPKDTSKNARDFLKIVPVHKVFFIKYEFWYHMLSRINLEGIPLYLASGNFQRSHFFFKWYGAWFRKVFEFFTQIFVQDKTSLDLLQSYGYTNVMVAGDTRFDRVADIAKNASQIAEVAEFSGTDSLIIAGSTWEKDEEILKYAYGKLKGRCKMLIAPHEPSDQNVNRLKICFPDHILFSDLPGAELSGKDVLIVNTIGHLSSLYKYGSLGYIGGGFGKGIHNILEATAAGLPVLFGPNFHRFKEAKDLESQGAAFVVKGIEDGYILINKFLNQPALLKQSAHIAKKYTSENTGATDRIAKFVFNKNV